LTRDGAVRSSSNGQVAVDRHGRTRIRYHLTREDAQRVHASLDAMAQLHFAAGATEVFTGHAESRVARSTRDIPRLTEGAFTPNRLSLGSAHVTGSCRIGAHRRTSAVTCEGEHWDARGLYIIDGSLLPSAPAVNPQATIMAVATVLARRIAARHSGVPHARGGSAHAYPTLSDRAERANEEG
jgi:choline dehydrogenase-like flavoprotein